MSEEITSRGKRITALWFERESKYSRIMIDSITIFVDFCRTQLKESLFIDLNASKMIGLLFDELDNSKGYVICAEQCSIDIDETANVE